ncbi:MAG: shikimate kinase [Rhodospirillales bacterium]
MHASSCDDKDGLVQRLGERSIVLIGMMGAGKSHVGRRLAGALGLPFVDADEEVERAAGRPIADIFEIYGESAFREGEVRVMRRLLRGGPQVLAAGGGAFMSPEIRDDIAVRGVSVWLRAELDVLHKRTKRRGGRPKLDTDDPKETLRALMEERHPVYAQADITIDTGEEDSGVTAGRALDALCAFNMETLKSAAP